MIIFTCRITWSVQISWRKMYIILKYRSSKTLNIQIIIILGKLFWYILLWLFLRLTVQIRIECIPDFFSIRWNSPLFHICCSNILVEKQVLFFLVRCMIFVFVAIIRVFFVFKNFENYNTSKLFEMNQINNVVFSDIIYEFTWITLIEFCLTPKQYCKNVCKYYMYNIESNWWNMLYQSFRFSIFVCRHIFYSHSSVNIWNFNFSEKTKAILMCDNYC